MLGGHGPHTPHRGVRPLATDAFGLNPPSQLVIGNRWVAFLNQVRKASRPPIYYEFLVQNRPYLKN